LRGEVIFLPGAGDPAIDDRVSALRDSAEDRANVGLVEIPVPGGEALDLDFPFLLPAPDGGLRPSYPLRKLVYSVFFTHSE
jgi:hypothetical protein